MEPKIILSVDKADVVVGDVVQIHWDCNCKDVQIQLAIDNGFKQQTETVTNVGSKRIRINRASNGKVRITLWTVIEGKTYSSVIDIDVKDRHRRSEGKAQLNEPERMEDGDQEEAPWWRKVIFWIATFLITVPILPFVYKLIPDLNWNGWDRVVEFVLLLGVVGAVLSIRWWLDIVVFVVMITILTMGTIKGNGYGFMQLFQDYGVFMYERNHKNNVVKYQKPKTVKIPQKEIIKDPNGGLVNRLRLAADYTNPVVRNFAVQQTTEEPFATFGERQYSEEMMKIVHAFAVFKNINNNWKYVHDPKGFEYNSKASETIQNRSNGKFTGDCDDHAILMAACVQAVGAKSRIVLSLGHAYPELYLGSRNNAQTAFFLITKLFPEARDAEFKHHQDGNGDYWLNLDYTAPYPGGKFLQDSIVTIINL